jgi:hypothetical protein
MLVASLLETWRTRAIDLEPYAPAAAHALRVALSELADALNAADEGVTLREASHIGGYAVDSLQRMVAQGKLPNVGRKGRPRIPRMSVPVKPGFGVRELRQAEHPRSVTPTAVVAAVIRRGA